MAEYIERDAAQTECMKYSFADSYDAFAVYSVLKAIPAADVRCVIHSKWEITDIDHAYGYKCYHCPECGEDEWRHDSTNYCPNCGAKMDG